MLDFRYSLSFRLDFLPRWAGYVDPKSSRSTSAELEQQERERRERKRLYNDLGLKLESMAWATVELNADVATKLARAVSELMDHGLASFGSGVLIESVLPDKLAACEWFALETPWPNDDFLDDGGYPTCHASKHAPTLHLQAAHHVSERFREVVEAAGLTGLAFLWVRDLGRYAAPQWYRAIAAEPLGHGVDHPWVDPQRVLNRHPDWRPAPALRAGFDHLDVCNFRAGWTTGDHSVDTLLRLFPVEPLGLWGVGAPRYMRRVTPRADFAYIWKTPAAPRRGEPEWPLQRSLCCNRRARQLLIDARLVPIEAFRGIVLLDTLPPDGTDLDAAGACAPPVHTDAQLATLRGKEQRFRDAYTARNLPPRRPDMKRALRALRAARSRDPEAFGSGLSTRHLESAVAKLRLELPRSWMNIYRVSNGFSLWTADAEYRVVSLEGLDAFHSDAVLDRRRNDEDYADNRIYVGGTDGGDHLAIAASGACEDAPVVLLSHEDFTEQRRWAGTADFLESALG